MTVPKMRNSSDRTVGDLYSGLKDVHKTSRYRPTLVPTLVRKNTDTIKYKCRGSYSSNVKPKQTASASN